MPPTLDKQARCLRNGLDMRWGNLPPTPAFASHVSRHFEPFCCDAIAAALAVGFVPYRIRTSGTHRIPDVSEVFLKATSSAL